MNTETKEPLFISRNVIASTLVRAHLGVMRGRRQRAARGAKGVMIVPPAEPNSLGDAAMIGAVCSEMKRRGAAQIIALNYRDNDRWGGHESTLNAEYAYEGLSHSNRAATILKLAELTAQAGDCIVIGADVLDGGYGDWHVNTKLDLLRVLQTAGVRGHVLGFSYKDKASPGSVAAFRSLGPELDVCLRDPKSHERFTALTGLPAGLGADLAFLYEAGDSPAPEANWIEAHRERGCLILGYNINGLLKRYYKGDTAAYIAAHREVLVRLLQLQPKLVITLVPHDSRSYGAGSLTDPEICALVGEELRARFPHRVLSLPMPANAAEVAALVRSWDVAVSGRMHMGIACLREGVPVACWEFQDKVAGLLDGHFGLPEAILNLDLLHRPEDVVERLKQFIEGHVNFATQVRRRLFSVKQLARQNFAALTPTL